jgi:hypothetical protein
MPHDGLRWSLLCVSLSFISNLAFAQSLQDQCIAGDAPSCMKYSSVLNQACTQDNSKTPTETLICSSDVQCYQDKALGLQQYNASCSGANATTPACVGTKTRIDASCPKRNADGSIYISPSDALAFQQKIVGPGHTVFINWASISATAGGDANPVNYPPTMGFLGGSDDDSANVAFDNVVNRPEHVCLTGILDSGKVVDVPGKWISNQCNAVWNNMYVQASDFYAAIRYPNGGHGHWGLVGEQPDSNRLIVTPALSTSPGVTMDMSTSLVPCMAHYSWQKQGLDRAVAAITGDSLSQDAGNQLGYLVGTSCRFEFGAGQATSSDNVRVYYLTFRPPPPNPVPVKMPSAPPAGVQGRSWTVRSIHANPVKIYAYQHKLVPGAVFDCRPLQYVRDMNSNDTWTLWVPAGDVIDYRAFEPPLDSNGVCSGNFVTMYSLDGGPGGPGVSTIN